MVQIVVLSDKAQADAPRNGEMRLNLLDALMEDPSAAFETSINISQIEGWCLENGFEEWSTRLCNRFGLYLRLFAASEHSSQTEEHRNALANFFHCSETGEASPEIFGDAILVRLDGPNGKPVDLTKDEVFRAGYFINDLMDAFKSPHDQTELFAAWKACYPYYDVEKGDRFWNYCFGGSNGRFMSGLTGEQLADGGETVPFPVVESFELSH